MPCSTRTPDGFQFPPFPTDELVTLSAQSGALVAGACKAHDTNANAVPLVGGGVLISSGYLLTTEEAEAIGPIARPARPLSAHAYLSDEQIAGVRP